ncbi:hypothetical protein [Chitinophaga polysaccharea]|nr:hypothetical protein [Chitinophaga polysaccharea]
MTIRINNAVIATTRYETAQGRHAIISLYKVLYAAEKYAFTLVPDEYTAAEAIAARTTGGKIEGGSRDYHISSTDHPSSALAS